MTDPVRPYEAAFVIVDVDEAERMRGEGKTLAEIAQYFGCTRQAVQSKLAYHHRNRRRYQDIFEACPYIGLRNYMLRHREFSIGDLCRVLFNSRQATPLAKTRNMLAGMNTMLSIRNVKAIEKATGMSFAELFKEETDE
jgi:hypothetical protein